MSVYFQSSAIERYVGCFGPGFAALKRARNQDHSVSCPRDLPAHPPTLHDRSHKTFTRKRGALFAPLTHRARVPPDYHYLSSSERLQEIMKQIQVLQENFVWITDTDASVDSHQAMSWRRRSEMGSPHSESNISTVYLCGLCKYDYVIHRTPGHSRKTP